LAPKRVTTWTRALESGTPRRSAVHPPPRWSGPRIQLAAPRGPAPDPRPRAKVGWPPSTSDAERPRMWRTIRGRSWAGAGRSGETRRLLTPPMRRWGTLGSSGSGRPAQLRRPPIRWTRSIIEAPLAHVVVDDSWLDPLAWPVCVPGDHDVVDGRVRHLELVSELLGVVAENADLPHRNPHSASWTAWIVFSACSGLPHWRQRKLTRLGDPCWMSRAASTTSSGGCGELARGRLDDPRRATSQEVHRRATGSSHVYARE